jgi:hypothetical protein
LFGKADPQIYVQRSYSAGPQSYSGYIQAQLPSSTSTNTTLFVERGGPSGNPSGAIDCSTADAVAKVFTPSSNADLYVDLSTASVRLFDIYGTAYFRPGDATRSPQDGDVWTYDNATQTVVPRAPAAGATVLEIQVFS